MDNLKFSRQELYELVWLEPVSKLSAKYNISEYDFRKICDKLNIPLPKAGHWQKVRVGKKIGPPPLTILDVAEQGVDFGAINATKPKELSPLELLRKEIEDRHRDILIVPSKLNNTGKLILAAKELLEREKKEHVYQGVVHTYGDIISIKVAPSNISRALRFFNSLQSILKARGHQLKVKNRTTYAIIHGEEIEISLREKLHRTIVEEKHLKTAQYHPSGLLIFKMDSSVWAKEWTDSKQPIENRLSIIIASLEIKAQQEIERKIRWQKEAEEKHKREEIERESEASQEKELENFKKLLQDAQRWQQTKIILEYIEDVKQKAIATNTLTDELKEWLQWASDKAAWYDPQIMKKDGLLTKVDRNALTLIKKYSYPG